MAGAQTPPARGLRLLSLDGGGIRGLSPLLIIQHLMGSIDQRSPPKPCDVFDMIGGTSTGGLIAIMLGRLRMTTEECISAYLELCKDVFRPQTARINLLGRAQTLWNVQGRFDSQALAASVKCITGTQLSLQAREAAGDTSTPPTPDMVSAFESALLLNEESACKTFVCAVREEFSDSVCLFRTYSSPRALNMAPQIWEAARATSAATTFFDPIAIGQFKSRFVDDALGFNNPVGVVLDEAMDQWLGTKNAIQCIVSIGTGEPPVGPVGSNATSVLKTLERLATQTEQTARRFARDHPEYVQEGKYYRFNVRRGLENVGLEEHEKINVIAAATGRYMEDDDQFKMVQRFRQQITGWISTPIVTLEREPSPKIVLYLQKYYHEVLLERGTSFVDFSTSTISLPNRLFTSEKQYFAFDEQWNHHRKMDIEYRTSWGCVLRDYHQQNDQTMGLDPRRTRMPLFDAPWYQGLGGLFLAHVPVSEIWRFITSTQSAQMLEPGLNHYGVSVFIKGQFADEPLFQLDPGECAGGIGGSFIASEELARCVVGRAGLVPNGCCGENFSNELPGLEKMYMPWTLFFTKLETRVFFQRHVLEAVATMKALLQVLYHLWDHEDAIDLYEEVVPVKVLLENYSNALRGSSRSLLSGVAAPANQHKLMASARHFFKSPSVIDRQFEIEDALTLIKDLANPDTDHRNFDVNHWIGYFGMDYARWICLALAINVVGNLDRCGILSSAYDIMLEGSSGMCYVA